MSIAQDGILTRQEGIYSQVAVLIRVHEGHT